MTKPHCSPVRLAVMTLLAFATLACQEETPTSIDGGLVPRDPVTVDIELPFDSFARGIAVYGGFGRNNLTTLGAVTGHAANAFGDDGIEVRTLSRFGALPNSAVVQDSTGASITETDLSFLDGFITLLVDSLASTVPGPVDLRLEATIEEWDANTASWTHAIDSAGTQNSWSTAGGGATTTIGSLVWDPTTQFDTIRFDLDSVTVARLSDTAVAARGVRIRTVTPATNVAFLGVSLSVRARPASNPDTIVALAVALTDQTFIYDPPPSPDGSSLWVGGAPAWRSVFEVDVPRFLTGPASLCAAVTCPVELTPELVTSALLTLQTTSVSTSFLPSDTLRFDARVVLAPELEAKSPIGGTLGFEPVNLLPSFFTTSVGTDVNVPITTFVQILLAGRDTSGNDPPSTLALVSTLEPSSLGFAAFAGPGQPGAPRIRLVLTIPESP